MYEYQDEVWNDQLIYSKLYLEALDRRINNNNNTNRSVLFCNDGIEALILKKLKLLVENEDSQLDHYCGLPLLEIFGENYEEVVRG